MVTASAYRSTTVLMCVSMRRSSVSRDTGLPFSCIIHGSVRSSFAHTRQWPTTSSLIGASKFDEAIGVLKVPFVFGGMDALRLHAVFGRENLEVLPDQGCIFRVLHHTVADTDTEFEAIADGLLQ